MDRRNWIIPSNQLIGQDPTIRFLVDQRRSAYDMIEKSMEVVAAANLAISHRMGEVDPDKAPGDVVIRTLVSKGYLNKLAQKWRGIVPMFDSHQNKINHQK